MVERIFVLTLALCALGGGAAHAQQRPVSGRVTSAVNNQPLAGVRVSVQGTTITAVTGADGSFAVSAPPGDVTLVARLIGYKRGQVAVPAGERTVQITLEEDVFNLEAVTVTAMLREQALVDVPFSIAAPTEQLLRLRGAENIEAISANVAGFSVQNLGPGQSQVAIRGTSSGQIARDQPGVKEQVGAYLDDAAVSLSLFTPDLDLFDVSRVEVLRGPQGTLFGAGSLAGTVRYISNQPELGASRVFGEVGGSWIDGGAPGNTAKLGFNVPLSEKAAFRVAAYGNRVGGYMDAVQPNFKVNKDVNGGDRTGVRAALRIAPSERVSLTPRIVYQRVNMDGWNRIDDFNILANPYTTTRPPVTLGERQLFTQVEEPFTDNFLLTDLNLRYAFGDVSLTSITSYTDRDILVVRDAGALTSSITGGTIGLPESIYTLDAPLDDATTSKVWTQEVRLAGGGDRVRWLVGGFYSDNKRDYGQSLLVVGFDERSAAELGISPGWTQGIRARVDELFYSDLSYSLQQFAVFGEATLSVSPRLHLTAGLRYYNFDESRDQIFDGIFGNDSTGIRLVSQPGSTDADGLAPRFIASYKASDALTLNAQASRGFRLGGINDPLNVPLCSAEDLATFSGRESWTDETAWNYEVGAKAQVFGGRGSFNVSAFYMDIRDLQLTVTAGSCSSRLIFNVAKARSQGLEVEFTASPSDHLDVSLSAGLNDSELQSTILSAGQPVYGMAAGNRLPSVPQVQVAAAATYGWPVGQGSRAFITGSYQHVGSRFTEIGDHGRGVCLDGVTDCPFGTVDITKFGADTSVGGDGGATIGGPLTQSTFTFDPELPAYSILTLRAGLIRENWELAVFLNNVTDEIAFLALDRERGTRARVGYLTNQPRTFGVTLRFNY